MNVEPERAAARVENGGASYYFCSAGCARRFEQAPEKYVAAATSREQAAAASASSEPLMSIAGAGTERVRHAVPLRGAPPSLETHHHAPTGGEPPSALSSAKGARYTCPMHPQIVQVGPGSCPICGMALEPVEISAEV